LKSIVILSLLVLLSGCSVLGFKNDQNTIYIENTATIKYTGKGAGASFALMGAMGPMGAAIGVAIDEGISKDIRKNIEASGFDLVAHLCEQYQKQDVYCVSDPDEAQQTLVIQSIDLTSKGSNDLMQVSVEASFKVVSTDQVVLTYHSGATEVPLQKIKSGFGSVEMLFKNINFGMEK
jgi:hypothetical protein